MLQIYLFNETELIIVANKQDLIEREEVDY